MESETNGANQTVVTEFVLLGLHEHHNLEMVLFVLCLGIYSVNVLGNALLIGLNMLDPACTPPCTSSSATSPSWTSVAHPPSCLSCWSTFWKPKAPSPSWLCPTDVPDPGAGLHRVCAPGHDGV